MIDAGAKLTAKLDDFDVPVLAALWLFSPEFNDWRLTFTAADFASVGPRKIYRAILDAPIALGISHDILPLESIGLLDENNQTVRLLRKALQTGPGISQIRFRKNAIDGHFVEDALIHRLN